MKRPMCVIGFSFALALRVAFFCSSRQAFAVSIAAGVTGLFFLLLAKRYRAALLAVCLACFSAAGAFASFTLYNARYIEPFEALSGQDLLVEGIVTQVQPYSRSTSYTLKAKFVSYNLPKTGMTVRSYQEQLFDVGDILYFQTTVQTPPPSSRLTMQQQGIVLMGTLKEPILQARAPNKLPLQQKLESLREYLYKNISLYIPGENGSVIRAMVLGNKDGVSSEIYLDINRAGTIHLLSVSGLHLSILATAFLWLFRKLRFSSRLSSVCTIAVCILFSAVTGLSAPIFRALVMTSLTLLGTLFSRRSDSLTSLACALLLICIIWPQWVLGRGLWLSVGATLGILLFSQPALQALDPWLEAKRSFIKRFAKPFFSTGVISLCAYTVTLPILFITFGWAPVFAPLANILIAPFVVPLMLGGTVCALFGSIPALAQPAAWVADFCCRLILEISRLVAKLPFGTLGLDESYMLLGMLGMVLVGVVVWFYRSDRRLWIGGLAACIVFFSVGELSLQSVDKNKIELVTLSNSDSSILLRNQEAVLLGTPDRYEATNLSNYLQFRGVQRIVAVIAVDCGEQVGSGLQNLADTFGIDCIVGPDDAYILQELSFVLPNIPVYAGGYATTSALGGAFIQTHANHSAIQVQIGNHSILKKTQEYAILKSDTPETIVIYNGGIVDSHTATPLFEPIGRSLFGEVRFSLPTE